MLYRQTAKVCSGNGIKFLRKKWIDSRIWLDYSLNMDVYFKVSTFISLYIVIRSIHICSHHNSFFFFLLYVCSCCFYTPPLKCGEVLCYTLQCLSVRPSVRPSVRAHHFRSITWVFIHGFFFNFCIHIVIGDEWCGIVNGQNPSIFNGVTALFRIGKMVSGLLFLYYSWYLNETSQICCTSKVTYCD